MAQDPQNIPYDPRLSLADQVHTSLRSSFCNLLSASDSLIQDSTIIDSVVIHLPLRTIEETMEVWRTLESYIPKKFRNLGISNTDLSLLKQLYEASTIKLSVVQNRSYDATGFDNDLWKYCVDKGIVYQAF